MECHVLAKHFELKGLLDLVIKHVRITTMARKVLMTTFPIENSMSISTGDASSIGLRSIDQLQPFQDRNERWYSTRNS